MFANLNVIRLFLLIAVSDGIIVRRINKLAGFVQTMHLAATVPGFAFIIHLQLEELWHIVED